MVSSISPLMVITMVTIVMILWVMVFVSSLFWLFGAAPYSLISVAICVDKLKMKKSLK